MKIGSKSAITATILLGVATAGSANAAFFATSTIAKVAYAALSLISACATYASNETKKKIEGETAVKEYFQRIWFDFSSIPPSLLERVTDIYTPGEAQVRV